MSTRTINRINLLASERTRLYQRAGGGGRTDARSVARIQQVSRELETLWDQRRRERTGRLEGVDLIVHRAYEQAYGRRYEDAISPPTVAESEDDAVEVAA